MILDISERLIILNNFLPAKGDLKTLILSKDMRDKLSVTQEELEGVIDEKNKNLINISKAKENTIEIDLTNSEILMLKEQIETLDKQKEIRAGWEDLCLKIKNL